MNARCDHSSDRTAGAALEPVVVAGRAIGDSPLPAHTQQVAASRVRRVDGCVICLDRHSTEAAADGATAVRRNPHERGAGVADHADGIGEQVRGSVAKHHDDAPDPARPRTFRGTTSAVRMPTMSKIEEFEELRPLLFSIAYRILGGVSEAEDAVQETWLRFDRTRTRPESTKAFLSTAVTRISIDVLRSARVRREEYPGPWFPEPLLSDPHQDPARAAELADSVSMAALLLLERLSPLERAVFVLREVFGFGFGEVAEVVGRTEPACRQLAARARRHMEAGRPRFDADRADRQGLASRFFDALFDGDVEGLQELLAADVQLAGDGGGKAPQLARTVVGAEKVARLLGTGIPWMARAGVSHEPHEVNGQPGAIFRDREGRVLHTLVLDVFDGRIQAIRTVLNPDKLSHLGPVGDAWALDREIRRARRHHE